MKQAALLLLLGATALAHAEPIGSVDTAFKLIDNALNTYVR